MRIFLIGLFVSLGLASCKTDVTGVLTLTSPLEIKHAVQSNVDDGYEEWTTETATLSAGEHKAKLTLSGCCTLILTKNPGSFRSQSYQIELPKNTELPEENGHFELKGAHTGQSFDLLGELNTRISDGPRKRGYESCMFSDYRQVCDHRGCYTQHYWRNGYEEVEYLDRTTTTQMRVAFNSSQESESIGKFEGSDTYTERVILYRGICR